MIQTDNPAAGYIAIVIGPDVPKTGETPSPVPSASAGSQTQATVDTSNPEPTATSSTTSQATGTISIDGFICAPGVTAEQASIETCSLLQSGWDASLTGNGISKTVADAATSPRAWTDLPFGTYTVAATLYPAGAKSVSIQNNGAPGDGTFTLSADDPERTADLMFLQPAAAPTTANLQVTMLVCPAGFQSSTQCTPPDSSNSGYIPIITGANAQSQFSPSNSQSGGNGVYVWQVPADSYSLTIGDSSATYVVEGTTYQPGSAYQFATDGVSGISIVVEIVVPVIQ